MPGDDDPTKVAIACQGGGSHTAFGAGVLARLFREWDDDHELVGLSGNSGGAMNAAVAWHAMVTEDKETAADRLEAFWDDLAADGGADLLTNNLAVWWRRAENAGAPIPSLSPYFNPGARTAQRRLGETLERHADFDAVADAPADAPRLVVGTVDAEDGEFETFVDEDVSRDAVLASGAVPDLFPGVEIDGTVHWDGLFSQNPPLRDLVHVDPERKPDEIWIVQTNPRERDEVPTTRTEILNRRNELAGNLSLEQEVHEIETFNETGERVHELVDDVAEHLPDEAETEIRDRIDEEFARVDLSRIGLEQQFDHATKLDRRPTFVETLFDLGRERAAEFRAERERTSGADAAVDDGAERASLTDRFRADLDGDDPDEARDPSAERDEPTPGDEGGLADHLRDEADGDDPSRDGADGRGPGDGDGASRTGPE